MRRVLRFSDDNDRHVVAGRIKRTDDKIGEQCRATWHVDHYIGAEKIMKVGSDKELNVATDGETLETVT